ncbi:hypothetical protein PICSAR191_04262 [Mycobacterium avium subsp. paratuberculosis]|nr:hypothetical protein PICSAR14_04466 [Mycobacterium avium subsp. paratuberculosis]CAG7116735.1 hypothetical protein PICSAR191_04262 [Mycobacterium avium subsp. paratuberculosis]CAG7207975.1 hypothetical protein PICSAR246_04361 [Mycobacterium avium subsp. paratuberculosis]CAG7301002.1 hypothetical protein PICSAR46_04256 [Mycobacterium avium subsp. paratuberculosis]CAG7347857.1 hypothetical protein PICSAR64_04334 [Mycobacterium avium subsp. paratuberculosis]
MTVGHPVDAAVEPDVAPVGVVEHVGVQHGSVQGGVEGGQVVGVAAGHRHPGQRGVPLPGRGGADVVETGVALGRQVGPGPLDADVGDRGARLEHRAGRELDVPAAVRRVRAAGPGVDGAAVPGPVRDERPAELHREVHGVGVGLVAEAAAGGPAGDGGVVLAELDGGAGVAGQRRAGTHLQQGGPAVARVAEPSDAGVRGGGEFGGHPGAGESHRVIAGHPALGVVVGDAFGGVPGLHAEPAGDRQHRDVAERSASHRGVRHAEPGRPRVVVVVAGVVAGGVRRVLHHPERDGGAGEVVDLPHRLAAGAGADERHDVVDGIGHEQRRSVVAPGRRWRDHRHHHGQGRDQRNRGHSRPHTCLILDRRWLAVYCRGVFGH